MRRVSVLVLLIISATAAAEPPPKPHKSLATALGWSLGVTALGVAAGIGMAETTEAGPRSALLAYSGMSLLVGPSIGRVYTGHYVTAGAVTRLVGLTVFAVGQSMQCLSEETPAGPHARTCDATTGLDGAAYLGAGIMALGALWDLASIPDDVAESNAHAALVPTAFRTPSGALVPGLAIAGEL